MARLSGKPKNLNSKGSEYIENNLFKENPDGLPTDGTVPYEGQVIVAKRIPEIRRVVFLNGRDPGYPLDFHYHSATHPLKHYTLHHGKEYDLSVEIIDHLETRAENQYGYRNGITGLPEMYVKSQKYLYRCQPVRKSA